MFGRLVGAAKLVPNVVEQLAVVNTALHHNGYDVLPVQRQDHHTSPSCPAVPRSLLVLKEHHRALRQQHSGEQCPIRRPPTFGRYLAGHRTAPRLLERLFESGTLR